MIVGRTHVGLDVHAHAVVGAAVDAETGELFRRRMGSDPAEVLAWLRSLPGPVAAAYEAGPTGFTLARALEAAGVRCLVLAPSKLQRPVGERVKTDARDALHIARLLRLDEVVPVMIPSESQEAARDLVRAREDARRDLMSARRPRGRAPDLALLPATHWESSPAPPHPGAAAWRCAARRARRSSRAHRPAAATSRAPAPGSAPRPPPAPAPT